MLHLVLLIITAVLLFTKYLIRHRSYWRQRSVKQIDGVVTRFMLEKCSLGEIYKEIIDENPFCPHYGIFLGSNPTLLLNDLRDIESVLQSDFFSFNNRGIVTNPREPLVDNLLFINNYKRWKLIKQKFSPMLTNMKIKYMLQDINKSSRDFFDNITVNDDVKEYSFKDLYSYITAIVAASIFGTRQITKCDVNALTEMFYSINDASTANNLIFYISNTYPNLFKLLNLKHFRKYNDFFVNFVKIILESRRNEDEVHCNDILDSAIQLQTNGTMRDPTGYEIEATDELLAAQYFLFFLGGVDNITISLQFTLLELAQNRHILKRLHDEIDAIYENYDKDLTLEDLGKLNYLDMVVSETLRKYPPISALQRCCTSDTNLPSTGLRINKGTIILVPVFALHRDPKLHPNPDLFDPERFSYENRLKMSKFSYLPFGEGQRKCLGVRFGKILLKYSVATILRRFTLLERNYESPSFEHSFFSLKDITTTVGLIPRDNTKL